MEKGWTRGYVLALTACQDMCGAYNITCSRTACIIDVIACQIHRIEWRLFKPSCIARVTRPLQISNCFWFVRVGSGRSQRHPGMIEGKRNILLRPAQYSFTLSQQIECHAFGAIETPSTRGTDRCTTHTESYTTSSFMDGAALIQSRFVLADWYHTPNPSSPFIPLFDDIYTLTPTAFPLPPSCRLSTHIKTNCTT